ncbi:MAG TPA: DUF3604 domain-containing protein [Candidatus Binatia bacterium]|jgi:hypothetical protein
MGGTIKTGPVGRRALVTFGAVTVMFGAAASSAFADPPPPPAKDWTRTEAHADCDNYYPLRHPFFGDTHVHTKYSADAVLARTRNTPYDAYNFALGTQVGLPPYDASNNPGRFATIETPLDFTAITDHSEGFGEAKICLNPGYDGYNAQTCQDLRATFSRDYHPTNPLPKAFVTFFTALTTEFPSRDPNICGAAPDYQDCRTEATNVWGDIQTAAEQFYDRSNACSFTTFVAYEWSGNTFGNNLHRNVIFRNAEVPVLPTSYYEQNTAEGLWTQLQLQCKDSSTNCDVLAIPHNSNIANDQMFSKFDVTGMTKITAQQAALRASMEPIMELTQVKGDSECRDGVVGTTDELCNFEKLSRQQLTTEVPTWDPTKFKSTAYARGALKLGLQIEASLGVNPFALGFIGATDTHNGVPGATSEIDYGKIGFSGVADSEPAFILAEATPPSKIQANGGGLSVVWAEENSRDAIFAAMKRKETYSTSGTRPIVRSFAGRYPLDMCGNADFVANGYDKGVPMGGDIGPVRGKLSPRFAIMANMDPGATARPGTPLQHAQIIKGWIDSATEQTSEKVYEVAGDPSNGADVDLATCNETNANKGFATLCSVWEDPDFDATQNAFYYLRVLEDPVCRWSHRLCTELKTCSVLLQSCHADPTRTCATNDDCVREDPNNNYADVPVGPCDTAYPALCEINADCTAKSAGTCGTTPAVDCSNPSSVPPGATECCDPQIPQTIQERAVASPIWYHPGRVGMTKGRVQFGKTAGEDKLQITAIIPKSPPELDPATNALTLTISDDTTAWTVTLPAATMTVKKPGASYSYKDKTGANSGLTGLSIKISKGFATLKIKGLTDLSSIAKASQALTFELTSGTYDSSVKSDWTFADPKLSLTF